MPDPTAPVNSPVPAATTPPAEALPPADKTGPVEAPEAAEDAFVVSEPLLADMPLVSMETATRAGFGPRLAAWVIDALLVGTGATLLSVIFWIFDGGIAPLSLAARHESPAMFGFYWSLVFLGILAYHFLYVAAGGRTPGKQALGLIVLKQDGTSLLPGDVAWRMWGALISTLALGLGFLAILWDKDNRAWHDRIARTDVVSLDER